MPSEIITEDRDSKISEPFDNLFSVNQITIATVLGTPIAGFLLLAQNYRKIGSIGNAWNSVAAGIGLTIIVFIIAFLLPENFPNFALPVGYSIGIRYAVQHLQGDLISKHESTNSTASWIKTIAVGILSLILVSAIVFVLIIVLIPE